MGFFDRRDTRNARSAMHIPRARDASIARVGHAQRIIVNSSRIREQRSNALQRYFFREVKCYAPGKLRQSSQVVRTIKVSSRLMTELQNEKKLVSSKYYR